MGNFLGFLIDILQSLQDIFSSFLSKFKKPNKIRQYNGLHDFEEQQFSDFDIQHQTEYNQIRPHISVKTQQNVQPSENYFYKQRQGQKNDYKIMNADRIKIDEEQQAESRQKLDLNPESLQRNKNNQQGQFLTSFIIDKIKADIKFLDLSGYQQLVTKIVGDIPNIFVQQFSIIKRQSSQPNIAKIYQFPAQKTFKYKITYQLNCNFHQYSEVYTDVSIQKEIFLTTKDYREVQRIAPYFKKYFLQLKKFMILERRCFNYFKLTRKNQMFAWSLCFSDQKQSKDVNGAIMGKIFALNIFRPIQLDNKQKIIVTSYFDADLRSSLRAQKIIQRGLAELCQQIARLSIFVDNHFGK